MLTNLGFDMIYKALNKEKPVFIGFYLQNRFYHNLIGSLSKHKKYIKGYIIIFWSDYKMNFLKINDDCLLEIFKYINGKEINVASLTCKRLHQIAKVAMPYSHHIKMMTLISKVTKSFDMVLVGGGYASWFSGLTNHYQDVDVFLASSYVSLANQIENFKFLASELGVDQIQWHQNIIIEQQPTQLERICATSVGLFEFEFKETIIQFILTKSNGADTLTHKVRESLWKNHWLLDESVLEYGRTVGIKLWTYCYSQLVFSSFDNIFSRFAWVKTNEGWEWLGPPSLISLPPLFVENKTFEAQTRSVLRLMKYAQRMDKRSVMRLYNTNWLDRSFGFKAHPRYILLRFIARHIKITRQKIMAIKFLNNVNEMQYVYYT